MKEKITHSQARAIMGRFCNSHFNNPGEHARISIPADPTRDDDLRMMQYIEQNEKKIASLTSKLEALKSEIPGWIGAMPEHPNWQWLKDDMQEALTAAEDLG